MSIESKDVARLEELQNGSGILIKRPARRIGEKSRRGFAAMSPEQQRRIASEGGRASHESGRGHRFSSEEARAAGRKGGQISRRGKKKSGLDKA